MSTSVNDNACWCGCGRPAPQVPDQITDQEYEQLKTLLTNYILECAWHHLEYQRTHPEQYLAYGTAHARTHGYPPPTEWDGRYDAEKLRGKIVDPLFGKAIDLLEKRGDLIKEEDGDTYTFRDPSVPKWGPVFAGITA